MLHGANTEFVEMAEKNYLEGDTDGKMNTTPERFYQLLNEFLDSHKSSRTAAARELAAITRISQRMIMYYASKDEKERKEPTFRNFLIIMEAIGRQVQDFPKED